MFDWLAVGWNLAMTVAGAFVVSLVFQSWPLPLGRRQATFLTALAVTAAVLLMAYPHSVLVLPATAPVWLATYGDLRFIGLVTMILAFRPGWALLGAVLTTLAEAVLHCPPAPMDLALSFLGCLGVLALALWQKPHLDFLRFSVRAAPLRLALVFLPAGLPYLLTLGPGGLAPTLLLSVLNLLGFLAGVTVLRSRFKLLALGARLSRQALTDPLTGLWNRRQLEHDQAELPVGGHVMVIDLDYFKTINDRFGHDVGDGYLVSAAAAIKQGPRSFKTEPAVVQTRRKVLGTRLRGERRAPFSEQAYRMGGEEFALLSPEPDTERAEELARHIMAQVRGVHHRANPGGEITCSVGIAQRLPGESPTLTLRRADAALLLAKANGRNRAEVASRVAGHTSARVSLKHDAPRPAQPLLWEAILASLSLAALDRDLTGDDWTRLLQAAILSVPGAESGTINVLQGERFVQTAQIGFSDGLLGLSHTESEQVGWYGLSREQWKRGQPRVLYGEAIAQASSAPAAGDKHHYERFRVHGRVNELRASLCIPVVMDGEVVGHLNLDRSSDERPFDEEDLRVARAFADQVTVLTVAARRRSTLEQQRREQAWLLDFSLQLLTVSEATGVARALLASIKAIYGLEGTLEFGASAGRPPENEPPPYRLELDWTGEPGAHLLFRGHQLGPHEHALLGQALKAANTALDSPRLRTTVAG